MCKEYTFMRESMLYYFASRCYALPCVATCNNLSYLILYLPTDIFCKLNLFSGTFFVKRTHFDSLIIVIVVNVTYKLDKQSFIGLVNSLLADVRFNQAVLC